METQSTTAGTTLLAGEPVPLRCSLTTFRVGQTMLLPALVGVSGWGMPS